MCIEAWVDMEKIILVLAGALITLLISWIKAWLDRKTNISSDLFKYRIQSLNLIWKSFMAVKNIFASKIAKGHQNWLSEHKDDAQEALDKFRLEIDKNQIILPQEIIEELRRIDLYFFEILGLDNQKPSDYQNDLNDHLNSLSAAVNTTLSAHTHTINLKFRT